MTDPAQSDYPQIFVELASIFSNRLATVFSQERAAELAAALAEDVRLKWGGGLVYIPKGTRAERRRLARP